MDDRRTEADRLTRRVAAMYNAHPFPDRRGVPPGKSDERYRFIYQNFLYIPLDQLRGKTFLDAGCGTGDVTLAWRRLLDPTCHVIGVDISQASISIARGVCDSAPLEPHFAVSSLRSLGLADHSVDLVLCGGVLVAVADPDRAFKELVRVLRPGGYMVLILYHRYGRALHGLRRAVIGLLEPEDIDRRARLGGRLFGHSMRRFAQDENVPLEGVLYDQFGLPCESRYTVGQALHWFREAQLTYLGTWPPVGWSQLGDGLRFSRQFAPVRKSWMVRLLLRLFPEGSVTSDGPPSLMTRLSMQVLWTLNQQQLFAISGWKE
jgi:SAM-dependent methyltransferase